MLKWVEKQQIYPCLSVCHTQYLKDTEWIKTFIFLHCGSPSPDADTFL